MPVPAWIGLERRRRVEDIRLLPEWTAPALALVLACMAGAWIGGPGAVAFPVPALLWCAVTYGQSATAVLTLLFSVWTMVAIAYGHIIHPADLHSQSALMSVRIGVALMALAPITVASVMVARNELLDQLRQLAARDPLTGVLNRRTFVEGYHEQHGRRALREREAAVMMLDIDHFKRINDTWGHAVGDQVLVAFARTVRECLRGSDLLGRFGGEEFVALMCNCSGVQAEAVAERVPLAVAGTIVHIDGGRSVVVTVSIGIASADCMPSTLDPLVMAADKALYAAKAAGRNQVACAARGITRGRARSDRDRATAGPRRTSAERLAVTCAAAAPARAPCRQPPSRAHQEPGRRGWH
jgi:diguanylate cyclase (GGDEF)-like protein